LGLLQFVVASRAMTGLFYLLGFRPEGQRDDDVVVKEDISSPNKVNTHVNYWKLLELLERYSFNFYWTRMPSALP
jgi:hypothetical protein